MPKARALMNVPATANRVIVPRLQYGREKCYTAGQQPSSNELRRQALKSQLLSVERAACRKGQAAHFLKKSLFLRVNPAAKTIGGNKA